MGRVSNVRVLEPAEDPQPQPPRRPNALLGLVGIAVALVVLVLVTGEFTGARTDSPSSTLPDLAGGLDGGDDLTTTTTEPMIPLIDRVDDVDGPLLAVTRQLALSRLVVWEPEAAEPQLIDLEGLPINPTFDASGRWLALVQNAMNGGPLFIGEPTDLTETGVWVSSYVWHDSEPGFVSWVESDPELAGPDVLVSGYIDSPSGQLVVDARGPEVGRGDRLVAAGDWGFLFQAGISAEPFVPMLYVLDRTGDRVASTPAAFVDNAAFGRFLVISEMERYRATLDRSESEPPADVIELATDGLAVLDFGLDAVPTRDLPVADGQAISNDGKWLARVTPNGAIGTTLAVDQIDGGTSRRMSFDDDVRLIGFAPRDRFLLLQVDNGRDPGPLLVVEWRIGSAREIPFDAQIQAVTVPLRDL